MIKSTEIRSAKNPVELRSDSEKPTIQGFAFRYNTISRDLGGFVERTLPNCANKTLGDKLDVMCRYNHSDDYLLGRTSSGTLQLRDIAGQGMWYENLLPETDYGHNVSILAARGDLTHSSFAFITHKDDWEVDENGVPVRSLEAIELVDVAPVNNPAYMSSSVGLRSLAAHVNADPSEVEKLAEQRELAKLLAPYKGTTYVDLAASNVVAEKIVAESVTASQLVAQRAKNEDEEEEKVEKTTEEGKAVEGDNPPEPKESTEDEEKPEGDNPEGDDEEEKAKKKAAARAINDMYAALQEKRFPSYITQII